jgi:hypothetical protein
MSGIVVTMIEIDIISLSILQTKPIRKIVLVNPKSFRFDTFFQVFRDKVTFTEQCMQFLIRFPSLVIP